jgi:hypothetical protein
MVIATLTLVVFVVVWTKPDIAATFEVLLSSFLSNLVAWHLIFYLAKSWETLPGIRACLSNFLCWCIGGLPVAARDCYPCSSS